MIRRIRTPLLDGYWKDLDAVARKGSGLLLIVPIDAVVVDCFNRCCCCIMCVVIVDSYDDVVVVAVPMAIDTNNKELQK